ncbi:MAG TPA: hypothetical protein VH682_12355 [Gemmataceae bacterium]|jgi:hypothetical protein
MSVSASPFTRRSWIVWFPFVLLIVGVVAVSLPRRKPEPEVWTLPTLAEHVREAHPELRILAVNRNGDLGDGFYLSNRAVFLGDLVAVPCLPEYLPRWHGVALCRRYNATNKNEVEMEDTYKEVAAWGDGGLLCDRFTVVGDPALVQQVAHLMPH